MDEEVKVAILEQKQEVLEKQIEYYKYYYDKYNKNTK